MRKVFYICNQSFWERVAKELDDEHGWKPIYWVGLHETVESVHKMWPDAVCHDFMDAMKGVPSLKYKKNSAIIDENVVRDFSFEQNIALRMMDRMDPGKAFDCPERERHYFKLLAYWLYVVDELVPDVVVFTESPHMVFDYILYGICKKKNITTFMFETFPTNGWLFPMLTFEEGNTAIINSYYNLLKEYQSNSEVGSLSEKMDVYFSKLSKSHQDAAPYYVQELMHGDNAKVAYIKDKLANPKKYMFYGLVIVRTVFAKLLGVVRGAYGFFVKEAPLNYLKQKNKKMEDSNMSGLQWRTHKSFSNIKKYNLRTYYNKKVSSVDFKKPYIFVPLQYQPEKTTSPDGGVFADQLRFIDMLRKVIPSDWSIVIKENPGQFWKWHGERSRHQWWYDDLLDMSNVYFTSLDTSTFDLIDHAKAVATVRGTAGWEAVARGIPAIIFGTTWYRGCEGVFYTPMEVNLREAIDEIQSSDFSVNVEYVRLFLSALEKNAYYGSVVPKFARHLGITDEENINSIKKAVVSTCVVP